ncbi:MAG: energy coupling factor transporter S component ThiW [Lachnospiraceae bacterium]|jgi:energy coupling factor transporter S component ThiW|nr:energy coupling factor transporter S component ThiW [Lachnospiraceae bacterium]
MKLSVRKTATAAMLAALAVAMSAFSIPIGASKCYPIQHMVNVICAVFLGPGYGVMSAFCTALIRNLMGTGSLLAFPGSMVGAFCCGMLYRKTGRLWPTYFAEMIGTGVIGGILCFPVATLVMGKEAAVFTYVMPFFMSTACGTVMAALLVGALQRSHALDYLQGVLSRP